VYSRILHRMREDVRLSRYVMTKHALEEMYNDGLTIFDVENGILRGAIVARQKDQETGEWKYVVEGKTVDEEDILVVVGKVGASGVLAILTTYLA